MAENLSFEERKARWIALSAQVAKDVAEHATEATFLPDVYRSLRESGLEPSEISYDMCHYGSE